MLPSKKILPHLFFKFTTEPTSLVSSRSAHPRIRDHLDVWMSFEHHRKTTQHHGDIRSARWTIMKKNTSTTNLTTCGHVSCSFLPRSLLSIKIIIKTCAWDLGLLSIVTVNSLPNTNRYPFAAPSPSEKTLNGCSGGADGPPERICPRQLHDQLLGIKVIDPDARPSCCG